jgi:hypothetical protein
MTIRTDSITMFSKYLHDRVFENIRGVAANYDSLESLTDSEYARQWIDQCHTLNSDARPIAKDAVMSAIREAWEDVTE